MQSDDAHHVSCAEDGRERERAGAARLARDVPVDVPVSERLGGEGVLARPFELERHLFVADLFSRTYVETKF